MNEKNNIDNQIASFITREILMAEITAGNTEFLKTAFEHLGLHGSQMLLHAENNCIKYSEHMKDHIYEDILEIILAEIFENGNHKLLQLLINHYTKKYPHIIKDAVKYDADPKLFEKYLDSNPNTYVFTEKHCTALYHFINSSNEANKKSILRHYEEDILLFEDYASLQNMGDLLKWNIGIDDLESNRPYQAFLSTQRKILIDYLGIKYGQLEKFIMKHCFPNSDICSKNLSISIETLCTANILRHILFKHGISIGILTEENEKNCINIIKWIFKNLCNAMLICKYNLMKQNTQIPLDTIAPQKTLDMVIAQTAIENPKAFFMRLVSSFFFELLAIRTKEQMTEYCKIFSFDSRTRTDREQELVSENSCLKAENNILKEALEAQEASFLQKIQKVEKESKNKEHAYEKQIQYLKKQLADLKKPDSSLQKQQSDKYMFPMEDNRLAENHNMEMGISKLKDKKILFLGGQNATIKKLKQTFTNAVFIDKKSSTFPDKIDLVVIFTTHISHALVKKFVSSNSSAKSIQCNSSNYNIVINSILNTI